jgi:hypothetical protein
LVGGFANKKGALHGVPLLPTLAEIELTIVA